SKRGDGRSRQLGRPSREHRRRRSGRLDPHRLSLRPDRAGASPMASYDLVFRGGTLVDPAQGIHDRRDVAFAGGMVAAVAPAISAEQAGEVIEANGKLVVPGLIDAHVHVYEGVSHYGINPDKTCLARGATTVVDAGSAGADTFAGFRRYVIEASATRILAH